MLTSDLVRVPQRGGRLRPQYVSAGDAALLELATTLVDVFERHVGKPRRELEQELKDLVGVGTSFIFQRGLAKLLLDRCEFETSSAVEPAELRRAAFRAAADVYTNPESWGFRRAEVKRSVCDELDVEDDAFEHGLYADLKSEQLLQEFRRCTPEWLLKRYNVALVQAVLLRATQLVVELADVTTTRCREVFRKIKFLRLLHEIESIPSGGYRLRLDGPLSLFKSSQRYGLQMAQLLPALIHVPRWKLKAEVRWGVKRLATTLELSDADGLEPVTQLQGQYVPEEVRTFEAQFAKLESDWEMGAAAEIVDLGGQGVLIPDHAFVHTPTQTKAYMEILGFWRRSSVAPRLQLLRSHGPENMILALSKELHVEDEELEDIPGEVYVFRSMPIAREVLKNLRKFQPRDG